MADFLVLLFVFHVARAEDEIEGDIQAAYYNPMMMGGGGMGMGMGGMYNPMYGGMGMKNHMGMGHMNMHMNPMEQMMNDPSMMGQMMEQMMNMQAFKAKVDEAPKSDVDSAQFMMMSGGGSCSSTCSCRQKCMMVWW